MLKEKLKGIIIGVILVAGLNYAGAAWSNPASPPTGGNPDVPVNVGGTLQSKEGDLTVENFIADNAFLALGTLDKVGIGNSNPGYRLDVLGDIHTRADPSGFSWLRTSGNGGWYNQTHSAGLYMEESSWIRVYSGGGTKGLRNDAGDICTSYGGSEKCLSTAGGGSAPQILRQSSADATTSSVTFSLPSARKVILSGSMTAYTPGGGSGSWGLVQLYLGCNGGETYMGSDMATYTGLVTTMGAGVSGTYSFDLPAGSNTCSAWGGGSTAVSGGGWTYHSNIMVMGI